MPVEIYLYRNQDDHDEGRFFAAVDGQLIADERPVGVAGIAGTDDDREFWEGDIYIDPSRNNHPTGFWLMPQYGLRHADHSVTFDDFEFWDDFPCDDPPCGAPSHSE